MAKHNIKFSCGHIEEKVLYGKIKERDAKIKYFEEHGQCSECWKAEQDAKRASENAEAAAQNAESDLPALEGSEKQIAWAEKIRAEILSKIRIDENVPAKNDSQQKFKDWAISKVAEIKSSKSAAWWIDNRDNLVRDFQKEAMAAAKEYGIN